MNKSDTDRCDWQWQRTELPYICERMIAFTIPSLETVLVMSYEGLHIVSLESPCSVVTLPQHAEDYRIFDVSNQTLVFNGCIYRTLGLHGGNPILSDARGNK